MAVYTVDELRDVIRDVAISYGVKKIALFGSYASGHQTQNSDIDLLIDKGELKGLFMFNSFVNALEERLEKSVDVITYQTLEKSLIKDTIKDEVILYEQ